MMVGLGGGLMRCGVVVVEGLTWVGGSNRDGCGWSEVELMGTGRADGHVFKRWNDGCM